ncbi:MAG: CarD family transcriptional regulator [Gemmiger sp.]
MFEPGSLIVYGTTGVCRVVDVGQRQLMRGVVKNCYTLRPLYSNETIYIPVDTTVFMRTPITKEQADELIDHIPAQRDAPLPPDLNAAREYYDNALQSHDCASLLQLVRQIYRKAQRVRENKRQPSQTDQRYLKRAEELLYGELAVALGIERDQVVPYIARRLGDELPA